MPVHVITPPDAEPVALHEAKMHLRVDHYDEDDYIESLIKAAREYAEVTVTHRAFVTQTLELTLDRFPAVITVPRPPLQSVSSLVYKDSDGTEHTLTEDEDYLVNTKTEPGTVRLAVGKSWPTDLYATGAVTMQYVAGYGAAAVVPQEVKQWILIMVGHWYENRQAILPAGHNITRTPYAIDVLLQGLRVFGWGDA